MEDAARSTGLVEIRRKSTVIGASSLEASARVRVLPEDGDAYDLEAPWAAACDGFHSPTRSLLGVSTTHKDYGADAVVADFNVSEDLVPPGVSRIVLEAARPHGLFRFGADRWRLVYRLNPGEDRSLMTTPETARAILKQVAPDANPSRLLWASAFRLGQHQSERYREGRFVLAGDAAHGMGPSAGAGLQVGVLGAWRLGWRLALAAKGHPSANTLLDDYAREQRAASDQVQAENMLIFRNMALRSPLLASWRAEALGMLGNITFIKRKMADAVTLIAQHVPAAEAVDRPRRNADHSWKHVSRLGRWRVGHRVPLASLAAQPSSLVAQGCLHTLVPVDGPSDQLLTLVRERVGSIAIPAHVLGSKTAEFVGKGPAAVAVVRPDQEVVALVVEAHAATA